MTANDFNMILFLLAFVFTYVTTLIILEWVRGFLRRRGTDR